MPQEDNPIDDSAMRERRIKHKLPPSSQVLFFGGISSFLSFFELLLKVRAGHSVLEARLLQVELLPHELVAALIKDDDGAEADTAEDSFSVIMKNGKLVLLTKQISRKVSRFVVLVPDSCPVL